MDARKLLSLVLIVAGLLAAPSAAVVLGFAERRRPRHRVVPERAAARTMWVAAATAFALVTAGIALTLV